MMANRQLPLFPSQPATPDEINKHTPLRATFPLFERYLKKEGKSQHTIKAFIGDMRLLAEFCGEATPLNQFTTTRLNQYLQWMENERGVPCSRKTYARRVTTLKVYFKWLRGLKAIPHDPAGAVLQRSGPAPLSHVLSDEQIRAAIAEAQGFKKNDTVDFRPELLFRLLLATGIKKSEAARLSREDFDRGESPNVMIKHKAKNVYKERRISIDSEFLKLLDIYMAQYDLDDLVFDCTPRNLEYILTDIGERADIPFKLSFEIMRWTSAVHDYINGVDEDVIREKLGLSRTSWYETGVKVKRLAAQLTGETDMAEGAG